jgi:hypothetical protein
VTSGIPFSLFANRRHRPTEPRSRTKDAFQAKRVRFWRRRAPTTFEKCLAVHMYYAANEKIYR